MRRNLIDQCWPYNRLFAVLYNHTIVKSQREAGSLITSHQDPASIPSTGICPWCSTWLPGGPSQQDLPWNRKLSKSLSGEALRKREIKCQQCIIYALYCIILIYIHTKQLNKLPKLCTRATESKLILSCLMSSARFCLCSALCFQKCCSREKGGLCVCLISWQVKLGQNEQRPTQCGLNEDENELWIGWCDSLGREWIREQNEFCWSKWRLARLANWERKLGIS